MDNETKTNLIKEKVCQNCGKALETNDKFCSGCGTAVDVSTEPSEEANNTLEANTTQVNTKNTGNTEKIIDENSDEQSNSDPVLSSIVINNASTTSDIVNNKMQKSKLFSIIGSIALGIIAIIVIATTLICDHEWVEATCTKPATCSLCEKTKGEPLGHSWKEATCTTKKTCESCGETEGELLDHTPGEWSSYTDYVEAENISEQRCTICEQLIDSKSTEITKLYSKKSFLLSPVDFIDRLDNKLDSLADNSLSAFGASTEDSYGCLIYSGTTKVGTLVFSNESKVISPDSKDNPGFSVLLGSVDDTDNIVRVFVSLIEACDPTLDLEEAKDIATKAIYSNSYTKNGITYVYNESAGDSAYLGVSLLK